MSLSQKIQIGTYTISEKHPPFIIAEMSGNHNCSLDRALKIVDAAAQCGAHALKIQTYKADTMTLDCSQGDFYIDDQTSLWKNQTLYELYQKAYTPWEWHEPIFKRCQERGLICFSTPFDESAVDYLEQFDPPCYKIASFENTDLPLIRKTARLGKPLIISLGMAGLSEIEDIVKTCNEVNNDQIIFLKCTSSYPASELDSNLNTIPHLKEGFSVIPGLSDHTLGIGVAIASVALGARVIEKHFTLDHSAGVDEAFSLTPSEFESLVTETARAFKALGKIHYGPLESESLGLKHRRSLYIAEDIKAGDTLNDQNLRRIRPGAGLSPKYYDLILGKKVKQDLKKGTPLSWDHFT